MTSNRETEIKSFLQEANWGDAEFTPVPGDASARRYFRVSQGHKKSVLMDVPMEILGPVYPEDAGIKERRAGGYNALARVAGISPRAFVCVSEGLSARGFSAPNILASDLSNGLVLLEDLGDDLYAKVIERHPEKEDALYNAAVDCLAAIYRSSFPKDLTHADSAWRVRDYDHTALLAEADLYLDWYAKDLGHTFDAAKRETWARLWQDTFTTFQAHASGLCLRDFHAENLFWLPDRQATARVGLIDYQDALFAHPAYDLVSLLEDARRDVSPSIVQGLKARFCEKVAIACDDKFEAAYAVMGAQRNAKILGIFVRLAERDGKPHYRSLIPRVTAHFRRNLRHPVLSDLKAWIETHIPETFDD